MAITYTTNYSLGMWEDGDNPGADALNLNWTTIDEQLNESETLIQNLDADVQTDINALAADLASQRNAVFDARMQRDSATQISLQQYRGSRVSVNGEVLLLDSTGLTCLSTHNLIGATGTDAGASLAVSTLYYAYVSNGSASYAPRSLRLSTTAPTSYNGIQYLAATGNGANWRFVGWVRTDGSTQFVDSVTKRLVVNYYNVRPMLLEQYPGYVDDNAGTTFTQAATADYVEINGGTQSRVEVIVHPDYPIVDVRAEVNIQLTTPATDAAQIAYGIDSLVIGNAHNNSSADSTWNQLKYEFLRLSDRKTFTAGYHFVALLFWNYSPANSVLIYADGGRSPSGIVDDPCSSFQVSLMG